MVFDALHRYVLYGMCMLLVFVALVFVEVSCLGFHDATKFDERQVEQTLSKFIILGLCLDV